MTTKIRTLATLQAGDIVNLEEITGMFLLSVSRKAPDGSYLLRRRDGDNKFFVHGRIDENSFEVIVNLLAETHGLRVMKAIRKTDGILGIELVA